MKEIRVKGDKADLVIGGFSNYLQFSISERRIIAEHIVRFIAESHIIRFSSTTPKAFLLQLAETGKAKDAKGREVYLCSAGCGDLLLFDYASNLTIPRLSLCYYGFTTDQVKQAILKELKPNPLIGQEVSVTIGDKSYKAVIQEAE
jgi:hypothetical protein